MDWMIVLENVSKVFKLKDKEVTAVDNANIHVRKGEIHGVIGYSGAGKSTLIRCVNMLEEPTSGTVKIDGEDITAHSPKKLREARQKIGIIFQGFNLLKTATVYDNIAIPLKLIGVDKAEIHKRTVKYLDIVGLADRHSNYPSQLSGGQKQRVAIARALSQEPEILLSDEATSALDPETTESILDLLLKINEEFGITILLITHEMNVIQKICDYVYVLEDGKIIENRSAIDLFTSPQHQTTKKFLSAIAQRNLSPTLISQLNLSGPVVRLTFTGEVTGKPLLAEANQKFIIKSNILAANIIELKNGVIGNLVIHFSGEQQEIEKALSFFKEKGVGVEELGGNN